MADPRQGPPHDDGTHPRKPNVGGPAPDRPPAPPGDPRRRHRAAYAIVVAAVVVVLGVAAVFVAPWFGVIEPDTPQQASTPPMAAPGETEKLEQAKPGDCREFTRTVTVEGQSREVTGTACMQQDGSWQIAQ